MEIIHIVLGKANPNRMNGVNKVVFQLANQQSYAGLSVSVWGITSDMSKNYGEREFKTRLYTKKINPFRADKKLLKDILSKKGKAVFHFHGGWIPVFNTLAVFMSNNSIPFVFTPHGAYNVIAMKRNHLVKKIYFTLFEKKIIDAALSIHCIGKSEVYGLSTLRKTAKSTLLPYGFEFQKQESITPQTGDQLIIGFVGRLDIYTKGLDLLLHAFKKLTLENSDAALWIIGDGQEKKKLHLLAEKLNIQSRVVFFGSRFGEEKNNLIKQMHVFAHPSRNEGLPSSVLEACNYGIPCIVTKATNVGDYIEEYGAGIVIEDENVLQLTNALKSINNIRNSPNYHLMKQNAQELVKKVFNWQHLLPSFQKMYLQ